MNRAERIKMVKAMEYIARQINDEVVFEGWLMNGVADGDIEYGDLTFNPSKMDEADFYISDSVFADLMTCFLRRMERAAKSGGLHCDGVVSDETWKRFRVTIHWHIGFGQQVEEDVIQEKTAYRAEKKALGSLMLDLGRHHKGQAVTIDSVTVKEE